VGAETVGSSLDLSNVEFVGAEGEVLAGPGDLGGFTGDAVDLGVDLGAPVEVAPWRLLRWRLLRWARLLTCRMWSSWVGG
jgi:hypothetical protein